jgi:hypothetical protein
MKWKDATKRAQNASRRNGRGYFVILDRASDNSPGNRFEYCDSATLETYYFGCQIHGYYENGRAV